MGRGASPGRGAGPETGFWLDLAGRRRVAVAGGGGTPPREKAGRREEERRRVAVGGRRSHVAGFWLDLAGIWLGSIRIGGWEDEVTNDRGFRRCNTRLHPFLLPLVYEDKEL
ncbi:hypothetical protein ACLOJK_024109 [Asimina triloba]